MRRFIAIIISMQVIKASSRKYVSSSDESIENLLYFKDCQHKSKGTTEKTVLRKDVQPTPVARQPDCPFPKMCCSMSCGNDCGNQQSFLGRQMEPLQNLIPMQPQQQQQQPPRQPRLPGQPQIMQRARKKKLKLPPNPPMPLDGRRYFSFTKDRIKNLISKDDDIRKILKDLVRVTMQKVDLVEMMNSRRNNNAKTAETDGSDESDEYE